jgi:hypothetical protein
MMGTTTDANTLLIISHIESLSERVSQLPTHDGVKVAVIEGIREHEKQKHKRKPGGKIPRWAQAVIGIITALGAAGAAIAAAM